MYQPPLSSQQPPLRRCIISQIENYAIRHFDKPQIDKRRRRTFDADIARLQIRFQVVRTRFGRGEQRVGYADGAVASSRAAGVGQVYDVCRAPDVSVVLFDAATQPHPTVTGVGHQDDRTEIATGVERLRFAVEAAVFGSCTQRSIYRRNRAPIGGKPPNGAVRNAT
jgi:hypothetical protein